MTALLRLIRGTVAALAITATALPAPAQDAVPPQIRFIVPFAPGAGTDVIARAVAQQLGARLGSTVVVENRPGASGVLAISAVVKGPRDGSMLLFTSSSVVTTAATLKTANFDLTADLAPVAIVADGPMLVGVSAASGVKTPSELVAYARGKTGGLVAGSAGIGSVGHLAAELLADAGKFPLQHIPYKGAAPALVDVASGLLDVLVASNSTLAPQIRSGRVVPIAVTSAQPSAQFPGVAAMASAAPGYQTSIWYGVMGPSGVAPALLQRLNSEVIAAAKAPEVQEIFKADGAVTVEARPDELARRIRDEYATWKRVAVQKGIVVE